MNAILDLRKEDGSVKAENSSYEIGYDYLVFKGGEPHITLGHFMYHDFERVQIKHRINSFNDLGKLAVAVDALKREFIRVKHHCKIELNLKYFPGARQDRIANDGEALTVKVYADMINAMDFDEVVIMDPHSSVTTAVVNNVYATSNISFAIRAISEIFKDEFKNSKLTPFNLICPDAGASKKIGDLYKELEMKNFEDVTVITGSKKRDTKTGELSQTAIDTDDLEGKPCVIVDDICDGGRTFINLAYVLKLNNAGPVYLIVTHGIFSYGFELLNKSFDMIYTTDSIRDHNDTWLEASKHHLGITPKVKQIVT